MSFPRYPKYKPSGVSWVGDAPEHWPIIRYKNVFKEKQSVPGNSLPSGSISFGRVVFKSDKTLHELTKASYQEVLAGEFLINPINLNYDLKSLRTGLSDINTCVSPAYIVLRAKAESDKNYLKYQLHLFDVSHMKTLGAGVRQTITFGDIGSCSTCLPPLPEQTAIAEFLDRETGKIDGLVVEQRRLMELLKEKRQAVISHAVTKGLNPHAPMKPSGIEWLGDVPAGWEVCALRHSISGIFNGMSATQIDESETTVPVTRIETISFGTIDESRLGYIESSDARRDRRLQIGDILFSNINSLSMIGNCAYYFGGREIYAGMNLLVIRPNNQRHARWLYWLIRSPLFRRIVESLAKPSVNQASIPQSTISGIVIGVPPLHEQISIAEFLDTELAKFDTLTTEAQRAIDLLQERRTALISAAVTGHIDVRQQTRN